MTVERRLSTISDEKGVGDEGIFDSRDARRWSHLGLAISNEGNNVPPSVKLSPVGKESSRGNLGQMRVSRSEEDGGPSLDTALQYTVKGVNLTEVSTFLRRKGRAIYINDQVLFNRAAEMEAFYNTLKEWQQNEIDNEKPFCIEGDYDMTILLALARSLAANDPNLSLDSPSAYTQSPSSNQQYYLPTKRKSAPNIQCADPQTSASTPEGALGRLNLPDLGDLSAFVSEMEMLAFPRDQQMKQNCNGCDKARRADLVQAALRYVLSCLDEVNKDYHKDGSSDYNFDRRSSSSSIPIKTQQRQDTIMIPSRGQSIMKKLTKKRLTLNPSLPSVAPVESKEASFEASAKTDNTATFTSLTSPLIESEENANRKGDGNENYLLLQQEKAKSAALEKELETIRAAIEQQESSKAEDDQLVVRVAETAREVTKAEEEKVIYQTQCEELQTRMEVIEEALYNAIGLLAEREENSERKEDSSDTENDGDFYSAGEEEESRSASRGDSTGRSISDHSRPTFRPNDTSIAEEDDDLPFPGRFHPNKSNSMPAVASSESHGSPTLDENDSRRGSHASWVRHTILPSMPQATCISPLPENPVGVVTVKKEVQKGEEVAKVMPKPLVKSSKMIDYSIRGSVLNKDGIVSRPKSQSLTSGSDLGTLESSWQGQSTSDGSSSTAYSQRDSLTPASSVDISSIYDIDEEKRISEASPERLPRQKSQDLREISTMKNRRPSTKRATSYKSSTSSSSKGEKHSGSSKYSILGHMPPLPSTRPLSDRHLHQRTNSDYSAVSIHSRHSQVTAESENAAEEAKSTLLDHYHNIHNVSNKDEEKATYFARRTRFRQEASL